MPPERIIVSSKQKVVVVTGALALGMVLLAVSGFSDRAKSMQEVTTWTEDRAVPVVEVLRARHAPESQDITLPGTIRAFYTASLFARASGYVTDWHKDIGARVTEGEALADISAPDLDQQLAQADAQLEQFHAAVVQAQANASLGDANNRRTSHLVAQGWSTLLQGDTDRFTAESRQAALISAKANVAAQQAVVNRLAELSRFKQIKAPFDGIIITRAVDIGDLVKAEDTSGRALFRVADVHRVRIYVDVPQAFLLRMKPGLGATLTLPGRREVYPASVVSTANSITEVTRTGTVELQADNPNDDLWPGAFTEVQFHIPSDAGTLQIPTSTLVFGRDGVRVAIVGDAGRVRLKPVVVGRNLGVDVEIRQGVALADRLINNPQEAMSDGDLVRISDGSPDNKPIRESLR